MGPRTDVGRNVRCCVGCTVYNRGWVLNGNGVCGGW